MMNVEVFFGLRSLFCTRSTRYRIVSGSRLVGPTKDVPLLSWLLSWGSCYESVHGMLASYGTL